MLQVEWYCMAAHRYMVAQYASNITEAKTIAATLRAHNRKIKIRIVTQSTAQRGSAA
jgi:hypothetical protein